MQNEAISKEREREKEEKYRCSLRVSTVLANAPSSPFHLFLLSGQKTLFSPPTLDYSSLSRARARKRTRKSAHNFPLKREEVVECFREAF